MRDATSWLVISSAILGTEAIFPMIPYALLERGEWEIN